MAVTQLRDTIKAARILKTARITGVESRYVRYVIDGLRKNEKVMTVYMELLENEKKIESLLMKEVNKLVPFN